MPKPYTYVNKNDLTNVYCPGWTATWHPIPHYIIVDEFDKALEWMGIGVQGAKLALSADGGNIFGDYTLDIPLNGNKGAVSFVFRSSTCKRFSIGACGGTYTFICGNECMAGDWADYRKHTSGITIATVKEYIKEVLYKVIAQGQDVWDFQTSLHEYYVNPEHMKILAYNFVVGGAIPAAGIPQFISKLDEEVALNYGYRTLYTVHSAVTRLLRGSHPAHLPRKTKALNRITNDYLIDYKPGLRS